MSDYSKRPQAIILDLIKDFNPAAASLTEELLSWGLPTIHAGELPRNTDLTITAAEGSGYSGEVTLNYNRVNLGAFPGADAISLPIGNASNVSELLGELNAALGVNIEPGDIVDGEIPAFPGEAPNETVQVTLTFSADNLVFQGSYTFTVEANDIPLNTVITTTELDGLEVPAGT